MSTSSISLSNAAASAVDIVSSTMLTPLEAAASAVAMEVITYSTSLPFMSVLDLAGCLVESPGSLGDLGVFVAVAGTGVVLGQATKVVKVCAGRVFGEQESVFGILAVGLAGSCVVLGSNFVAQTADSSVVGATSNSFEMVGAFFRAAAIPLCAGVGAVAMSAERVARSIME